MQGYQSVWFCEQDFFLDQLHDLYAQEDKNPSLFPYGRADNADDEDAFPVFAIAAMYGLFPGTHLLMPVAIVIPGVFMPVGISCAPYAFACRHVDAGRHSYAWCVHAGRHSFCFWGCRSPCGLDTAQPCRSRRRACLARKGARAWAFAARSSPAEQADAHARAGPVLQEERRCDCGTSALVKLILVGRHSYSRGAVDGMNMPVAIDIPLCSMPASIIYPPHCHRRFATTGALRISRGELRTGHGPCGGCGIRSSMPATGSCPHVSYAGRLTYSCRYHAGRHSYSGSTHRFPDFAIADCEEQDPAVQSRGKLLGPAQWPRECPTAAQQAQALKVPVRCLGLVCWWCVVDSDG